MTELIFPLDQRISRVDWSVVSNTAAASSIFNGAVKTLDRQGDRLKATITISNATSFERARLKALRGALRGQANRIYFADPTGKRGSLSTSELIGNGSFISGSTGWTSGASRSLAVIDQVATATAASLANGLALSPPNGSPFTVVAGAPYIVRSLIEQGRGTLSNQLIAGTTFGGTDLGTTSSGVTFGYKSLQFTPGGTSAYIAVNSPTGTEATNDSLHVRWISLTRCALVNGAAQTGSGINVDGLPNSTTGLALLGDVVQIGTQLAIVTKPLNSNSSGQGYLQFEPKLRTSPADNAPIMFGQPVGRFVATSNEGGWDDSPGVISNFQFELIEALDA